MSKSFAGFRVFLEKYEAKSQKDKEASRHRTKKDEPMDYLGGLQFQAKIKKSGTLQKIIRTTPEILSGMNVDGQDNNYVATSFNPGIRGGTMKAIDVGDLSQATRDGRNVDSDKMDYSKRHLKRKDIVKSLERGWGPAVAAAAGGAAPGAAPPM